MSTDVGILRGTVTGNKESWTDTIKAELFYADLKNIIGIFSYL